MDCQVAPSRVVVCATTVPWLAEVQSLGLRGPRRGGFCRSSLWHDRTTSTHLSGNVRSALASVYVVHANSCGLLQGYSRAKGSLPLTNQVAEFSMVTDVVSLFDGLAAEKAVCLCMAFLITWFDNRAYQIVIQGTFCTFSAEAG